MKNQSLLIVLFFCAVFQHISAQEAPVVPEKYTAHNKGKFYIFWGGNREDFSKSDIRFKGKDYDFTLYDVDAHDKPKGFHIDYFNPARMTIPQTNFRIGYFLTDKYNISIGFDHMKYVMHNDRRVAYSGYYPFPGSYNENPADVHLWLITRSARLARARSESQALHQWLCYKYFHFLRTTISNGKCL